MVVCFVNGLSIVWLTMAIYRDAILPDFSGIPDFHKTNLSIKNLFQSKIGKTWQAIVVSKMKMLSQLLVDSLPSGAT